MVSLVVRMPYPVVLASGSPRRRELLAELVADFEVVVPEVDEEAHPARDPMELAVGLALEKARAVFALRPDCVVIGGDTVVSVASLSADLASAGAEVEFELLAKPTDEADAHRMLRKLSGRTHSVVTGIALVWPGGEITDWDISFVSFRELSDAEIWAFIATGEPMDKAGAYGIQGFAKDFVARIEGSVSNVVGLPMEKLEAILMRVP